jgi:hypothetical protein
MSGDMRRRAAMALGVGLAATLAVVWFSRRDSKSVGEHGPALKGTAAAGSRAHRRAGRAKGDVTADAPTSGDVSPGSNRLVFTSPWGGSSLDQLGHERLSEGNALGPMSLAVDASGHVYVLDEVNGRVVRHDASGKPDRATPIELKTPEDLVVAKDGAMLVLDRHSGAQVSVYDAAGKPTGSLALTCDGLDDAGQVTGIFTDGSSVYAEKEHGPLFLLGDTSGVAATARTQIPGRPTRDGLSFITAGITDAAAGRTYVSSIDRATMQHRFTRELRMKSPALSIVLLDTDAAGTIYFGVEIQDAGAQPAVVLSCLEPEHGAVIGSTVLPANTLPEETFRDFVVLDGGGVIYALRSESGVSYLEADCT